MSAPVNERMDQVSVVKTIEGMMTSTGGSQGHRLLGQDPIFPGVSPVGPLVFTLLLNRFT